MMKGDKTIRLRDAAVLSGYHPDYLSYLIRNKKLLGIRKGRNWFVYEAELKAYVAERQEALQCEAPILKKKGYKVVFWPWLAFGGLALFLLLINYYVGVINIDKAEASDSADNNTKVIQTFYNDQGGKAVTTVK